MVLDTILVILAGLFGAAGIGLYAVAAHATSGSLDYAAVMLLAHAPALLGVALASRSGLIDRSVGRIAGLDLAIGVALFSGDLAMRTFFGARLFPMAAPIGGVVAIAGWLILGAAALLALRKAPKA